MPKLKVGDKIWFKNERQGYTVQARDERFIICTKPFNLQKTVLYTIIDLQDHIRGPDNMWCGPGYETRFECEENLKGLNGISVNRIDLAVSWKYSAPLDIVEIKYN